MVDVVQSQAGDGAELSNQLMSKAKVAKLLGVHTRTIDRWRAMGKLKGCQVVKRGAVRFRPETVEEFKRSIER